MVSLTERPFEISFSRNPIRYVFITDTASSTAGLRIDIRLYFRKFTAPDFTKIFELSLSPDSSGRADIDLNKVLDSLVNYQLPGLTELDAKRAFDQVGEFYLDYREATAASPSPSWNSDLSYTRKVIKGGLPYEKWQGPNYFVNYSGILTWQRSGRFIGPQETAWLTYLHLGTNNQGNMSARVNIYFTDGTAALNAATVAFEDAAVPKYGIYRIPVGITQLHLDHIDPTRMIHYYTVRVGHDAVNLTTEFKFEVDYRADYSDHTLYFFNSLGGFDSVRMLGEVDREAVYDNQSAETTVTANYYASENMTPMQFNQQVIEQIVFKGSVGVLDNPDDFDRLRDLRISKQVHEIKFGRWWPVNLINGNIPLGNSGDPVKDFPIEWTYGFVNENYAPDIDLGGLPVCPVITGLTATGTVISWTGDAAHVQYVIERWDNDMTALQETVYTSLLSHDFGFVLGFARVKALCGFSESPWSDFIYFA